jgi:hypothetical protein
MLRRAGLVTLSLLLILSLTACIQINGPGTSNTPLSSKPAQSLSLNTPQPSVSQPQESPSATPQPSTGETTEALSQRLIDYFIDVAVTSPTDTSKWNGLVKRWETPVKVEVLGDLSDEDYNTLNNFLIALGGVAPGLDIAFLEGDGSESGNLTLSFVPTAEMASASENYSPGDKGCYYIYWDSKCRITKGVIAIDTSITTQEERNSLITEFVARSLGILNNSSKYSDSIFYNQWMKLQKPSSIDGYVIAFLYSTAVRAGQTEADAREALRQLLIQYPPN